MKKIVIATTNKNKVKRIKDLFKDEKYEFLSLEDLNIGDLGDPEETASSPVGIAMEKAKYYVDRLPEGYIILTQDDTLSFEGVNEEDNPGLHIKKPVVDKYGSFSDNNAADYYTSLAKKYGGSIPVVFNYGHAVAIKTNGEREMVKIIGSSSKLEMKLVDKVNKLETVPGYFLSACTEVESNGKWMPYNDLTEEEKIAVDIDVYKSISGLLENMQ